MGGGQRPRKEKVKTKEKFAKKAGKGGSTGCPMGIEIAGPDRKKSCYKAGQVERVV